MRKIFAILLITLGLSYAVYAEDEYPYTQTMLGRHDMTYDAHRKAYGAYRAAIKTAKSQKDIDKLRELCTEFRESYTELHDLRQYLILFNKSYAGIGTILRSNPKDTTQYYDANLVSLTEAALSHIDMILLDRKVPAEILASYSQLRKKHILNTHTTYPYWAWQAYPDMPFDDAWETRRRSVAKSYIDILSNLEQATDTRWNPDRSPTIQLPKFTMEQLTTKSLNDNTYIPDYIKDPALKQHYIDVLEKKVKATYWWNAQQNLRRYQKQFTSHVDQIIAHMYSQEPKNIDELKGILKDNNISVVASERILNAVTNALNNPIQEPILPGYTQRPIQRPSSKSDREKRRGQRRFRP